MSEQLDHRLQQLVHEQVASAPSPREWDKVLGLANRPATAKPARRWPAAAAAAVLIVIGVVVVAMVRTADAPAPSTDNAVTTSASTTQPAPPPAPSLNEIDHVTLVDGEGVGETWVTGLARTRDEFDALWNQIGLSGDAPDIDFGAEVVVYFGPAESGSCRFGPLGGVAHDRASGRVFPILAFEDPIAEGEERDCTADANPHAILVAIAREDLPTVDFEFWVDNSDPPACCGNNVTRVLAGELTTTTSSSTSEPATPEVVDSTTVEASGPQGALGFGNNSIESPSVFGFEYGKELDPEAVIQTVSPVLGEPNQDTGWLPMPQSLRCNGASLYRSLLWDDIRFVAHRTGPQDAEAPDVVWLGGFSIGEVPLGFSPPLDASITTSSGITNTNGLGLGSPKSAIFDEDFSQTMESDGNVFGLASPGPVVFKITNDRVAAISMEANDC